MGSATQADPAKQPLLVANAIDNRPALRFDGIDDRLVLAEDLFSSASIPLSVFAVYRSNDHQGHLFGTGAETAGEFTKTGFAVGLAASKPFVKARSISSGTWLLSPENVKQQGPQILGVNVTASGSSIRTGCTLTTDTTTPAPLDLGTTYIGGTHDGSESFAGDIAELLVYNRTLTTTEYNSVWNYLSEKYDIDTEEPVDIDNNGVFDDCDNDSVYLKAPEITVTLEQPDALKESSLASVIDAASPTVFDRHTTSSHVWAEGETIFYFDLQADYELNAIHFWNFNEEGFDVDAIQFLFYDSSETLISQISVEPQIGFEDILAEDFAVDVDNVRYVRAILTGSNGQVEFQNIGFSGEREDISP